jgi:SET domain-containing protein
MMLMFVRSRALYIEIDGNFTECLTPFCDMINDKSNPNVSWEYDQDKGDLYITATRDIKANEEIFISYGGLKNN